MSNPSSPLPAFINSDQACLFNFYHDGVMQQGICYGANLYGLAYAFTQQDQLNAFHFASQLLATGCQAVITLSKQKYQVWVRLHANEYPRWQQMVKGLFNVGLSRVDH